MSAPGQRNRWSTQAGLALISVGMAWWLCSDPERPVSGAAQTSANVIADVPTVPAAPGDPPQAVVPFRDPITAFWLTTPRIKPGADGDEAVVLLPHLSQRLEDGSTVTRLSWRVEPAFDAMFGLTTSSTAAAVVGDHGEATDLEAEYWDNGDRQAQDEEQPLAYWRKVWPKPQILRIPAASVAGADACYRLHATLEFRDAQGGLHQLGNEQLVRFLPFSGQECTLPEGMRDPTGILPAEQAEAVLRSWLGIDDWYLECVAVIRLKAMGRTIAPADLAHFFRLAALAGNRPLVARALDTLGAGEGAEGAGQLLAVGCDWGLPWAVRYGTPGTKAWLRARLENLLADHPGDRENELFYQGTDLVGTFLAVGGPDALAVLERIADHTGEAAVFDLLLKAIGAVAPADALDLARRHHPGATFQTAEGLERLMRSERSEDVLAACQGLARFSRNPPQVQPIVEPLPEAALAPLLGMTADSDNRDRRLSALVVLACAREPRATAACLAALGDEYIGRTVAQALVDAQRTDVAAEVGKMARSMQQAVKSISRPDEKYQADLRRENLWPVLLLDPTGESHDLIVSAYLAGDGSSFYTEQRTYLLRHGQATAAAALQALASGHANDRAAELLSDLEDGRGVPALLERWSQRASVAATPNPGRRVTVLSQTELLYLATFVSPDQLAASALAFMDDQPYGSEESADDPLTLSLVSPATTAMERIRNYRSAYTLWLGHHYPNRPETTPLPSAVTILRLRAFPPAVLQPLTVSADVRVRAMGAELLAGEPVSNPTVPDAATPVLEHLLSDPDEQVRVQAFVGLESHCAVKAWCWQRLLEGRPEGPARALVSERVRSWGAGVWNPDGVDAIELCEEMLGWLGAGDSLGLTAVTQASANQTTLVVKALAGPTMTVPIAREILDEVARRAQGDGYAIMAAALQQPLGRGIRAEVIEHLATFAEERRGDASGIPPDRLVVRPAEPGAIQALLDALQEQDTGLRESALIALSFAHVPASVPVLEGMLEKAEPRDTSELARVIMFQGADERCIAPLENLLSTRYGLDQTQTFSDQLNLYVATSGTRGLPLLHKLAARLRTGQDYFTRQEYGFVIADLVSLKDSDTVPEQADWYFTDESRWRYDPGHLIMGDALKREIRVRLIDRIAHGHGEPAVDACLPLARFDSDAAFSTLVRDLGSDDTSMARRAQFVLGELLGNNGGGETVRECSERELKGKARAAARWWQVEQGRGVERLAADGLLP